MKKKGHVESSFIRNSLKGGLIALRGSWILWGGRSRRVNFYGVWGIFLWTEERLIIKRAGWLAGWAGTVISNRKRENDQCIAIDFQRSTEVPVWRAFSQV